jgi:hypothetical protein
MTRQRSLQKGNSGDDCESTGLRQMGQFRFIETSHKENTPEMACQLEARMRNGLSAANGRGFADFDRGAPNSMARAIMS